MTHQLRSSGALQLKCTLPATIRRYPAMNRRISMASHRRTDELRLHRRAFLSADKQNVGPEIKNSEIEFPAQPGKSIISKGSIQSKKIVEQNASIDVSKAHDIHNGGFTVEKEVKQEELSTPVAERQIVQMLLRMASGSSFFSLLHVVGIIASGVLGALYATLQKKKSRMESTIQYLKAELIEKEAAAALLKEDYEAKLWNMQEEQHKQAGMLEEKEASLSGQLTSANEMSTSLCQELHSKTRMLEYLRAQLDQLESGITQTGEDKKILEQKLSEKVDDVDALQHRATLLTLKMNEKDRNIENLKLSIVQKGSECKQLNSIIDHAKEDIVQINSTVEHLQEVNLKTKEKLDSNSTLTEALNAKINLYSEQEKTSQHIHDPMEQYDEPKDFSDSRVELNLELPMKTDNELRELQEKLSHYLSEITRQYEIIEELRKERDEVSVVLEQDVRIMKALKGGLDSTLRKLEVSRNENSRPPKVLEDDERSIKELTCNLSQKQEFSEANESCPSSLREANSTLKHLSEEFAAVKGVLRSKRYELAIASSELKTVTEECECLKSELIEIYKKAESSAHELKEERVIVDTLNKELEVLRKKLQKDTEARKTLETDLDEVTKLLDEMNKSSLLLSKEVEDANARNDFLGSQREILYKSLVEQKNLTKESKENLEDVRDLITRLGSKRELLVQRCNKLKKELASAKGEILQLRRVIDTRKESATEDYDKSGNVFSETPSTEIKSEDEICGDT